ncbi:hypothetical protein [Labrys wisconsinensis]|uniref:Uncharacterized protein n=1 Tax=Labrys wisconsinensis TaxID=425677 RepID=A0ABU0JE41_9HYPH|nr:hypothetical protein [Labrys wisconsinensis]MDQ0471688.1 hypothetical protein [Labrys wisconsinensis]
MNQAHVCDAAGTPISPSAGLLSPCAGKIGRAPCAVGIALGQGTAIILGRV